MVQPVLVDVCVAPGSQPALFRLAASDRVASWVVIDRHGVEHVDTSALGVALSVARRVLVEQGEVWVRASDDTTAHIDPVRVATDTPSCPWIQTIAATLEGATP